MKTYKELLNELANSGKTPLREITAEESAQLKKEILSIFLHVSDICKTNELTYMLCGGSCLGAIRHNGFIPWDDDLDIAMPREDFEKFKQLCIQGVLGEKYEYCFPSSHKDSPVMFMKVYRKDSIDLEMGAENSPYPKGIFLDIFIIDGVPNNIIIRKIKSLIANSIRLIANMVISAKYPSTIQEEFVSLNPNLRRQYKIRLFMGKFFSLISHKKWVYWYDKIVANSNKTSHLSIPTGRKLYLGETLGSNVFLPVKMAYFEGYEVPVPNDSKTYLQNLYGNFMQMPPENKREHHFIIDLKFPKENV